jgi:hypothetical protein
LLIPLVTFRTPSLTAAPAGKPKFAGVVCAPNVSSMRTPATVVASAEGATRATAIAATAANDGDARGAEKSADSPPVGMHAGSLPGSASTDQLVEASAQTNDRSAVRDPADLLPTSADVLVEALIRGRAYRRRRGPVFAATARQGLAYWRSKAQTVLLSVDPVFHFTSPADVPYM